MMRACQLCHNGQDGAYNQKKCDGYQNHLHPAQRIPAALSVTQEIEPRTAIRTSFTHLGTCRYLASTAPAILGNEHTGSVQLNLPPQSHRNAKPS
jgi:hypothetical protein